MFAHTIVTSGFKFTLGNWIRSIENIGGFPIIKYTARGEEGPAQISWDFIIHNFPNVYTYGTEHILCKPGMEILMIGDNIHFPVYIDTSNFALVNPRPEGNPGN